LKAIALSLFFFFPKNLFKLFEQDIYVLALTDCYLVSLERVKKWDFDWDTGEFLVFIQHFSTV